MSLVLSAIILRSVTFVCLIPVNSCQWRNRLCSCTTRGMHLPVEDNGEGGGGGFSSLVPWLSPDAPLALRGKPGNESRDIARPCCK